MSRLKLFFHCLFRAHQSYEIADGDGKVTGRAYGQCEPGLGTRYRMRTFG